MCRIAGALCNDANGADQAGTPQFADDQKGQLAGGRSRGGWQRRRDVVVSPPRSPIAGWTLASLGLRTADGGEEIDRRQGADTEAAVSVMRGLGSGFGGSLVLTEADQSGGQIAELSGASDGGGERIAWRVSHGRMTKAEARGSHEKKNPQQLVF